MAATGLAREWSDSTGKFKVEAELSDVAGDTVRLRKSTGDFASLPLARLSKADQEHVKKLLALSSAAAAVLKQHCYACHGEKGTDEGGMNYVLNGKRLRERDKVVAGQPDKSLLLTRIVGKEMPPEDAPSHPNAEQIQTLRDWITEGAFSPSVGGERPFVSDDAVLEAISSDLAGADERTRIFYRYFTITHLYNASLSDEELQTLRLALSKLLNSLSWDRDILLPHPVDAAQTVFRIDIRDLRWTRELWEVLILAYPYGVQHSGKTAGEVYRQSGTRLPYLRADWFVAQASSPPLYHALLQLPGSISGLQQQLKINFAQNVRQDRVLRAGFTNSGVSQNPRVIERHDIADGACWLSYDFAGSAGTRNFFNDPLRFEFDGNEVIFNLPNGLQAYMIFDREGNRLDKAPTKIVRDLRSPDATVVNGISCFRCHAGGMIPKQDEVRKHATANARAFGDRLKTIQALYPEAGEFDKALKADQDRYREALGKIGITRISPEGEPVYNITKRFSETVDLALASAEVGRTPADFTAALDRSITLQKVVGPLRVSGGTMPREAFEEAFGTVIGSLGGGRYLPPAARIAQPGESVAATSSTPAPEPLPAEPATSDDVGSPAAAGDVRMGLAHHWRFDETRGDIARDLVGRNNISLGNWDDEDPRWVKGRIGSGLQFSKPEQFAATARDIDFSELTITFWINVLHKGTNPRVVHPWVFFDFEHNQGLALIGQSIAEPTKPEAGEWQHYAVVIDQVKRKAAIYRNGAEVAGGKLTKDREAGRWLIGRNPNPRNATDGLSGILDDLRIYKRLLSAAEVEKLAGLTASSAPAPEVASTASSPAEPPTVSAGGSPSPVPAGDVRAGLAHHWKFDETKGDAARDQVGRNTASLANWDDEDPRWVKGKLGNALQFSKPEQIAMTAKDIDFPQLTITFWLNVQQEKGTNPRIAHPWVALNYDYETGFGVGLFYQVMEPTKPEPGEWHHYALAIDQVKHKATIYRDGDEVASGKITKERDPGRWVFGHNGDPRNHGDGLNGMLDDLRVYRRLLNPEEVKKLSRTGGE